MNKISIENKFAIELPGDPDKRNISRQVQEACYSEVTPTPTANAQLIHSSPEMRDELNLDELKPKDFLAYFSGQKLIPGSIPFAMCYGGHQFGNWAGQLGDGRAINLCEIKGKTQTWATQLKGAGHTPFSRTADGLAVLRSSIREYLCSEAMFHLGVPTTRALSLSLTGDKVMRDILYDGNPDYEKGAVVSRVAPSFIRFGSFEIFASRGDKKTLTELVNYTIKHHFSHLGEPSKKTYLAFFKEIVETTRKMVVDWQRVGFVHGVMNTDNMSIHGVTIDFGPYGWLEDYDESWTPNTTDAQNRRYRFGNQPSVALWNLTQLANALYPLIKEVEPLQEILDYYKSQYQLNYLLMMLEKIGVFTFDKGDEKLIDDLIKNLSESEMDFTLFFRNLNRFDSKNKENHLKLIEKDSYLSKIELDRQINSWSAWLDSYSKRLKKETISNEKKIEKMNLVNPKYVLRNWMSQLAIDKADKEDYSLINELFDLLKKPYTEQPEMEEKWFTKRPDWAKEKVGCSMLSCSS